MKFGQNLKIPNDLHSQIETDCIYNVYLKRQKEDIKIYHQENKTKIPMDFDFNKISGLSNEIKDILNPLNQEQLLKHLTFQDLLQQHTLLLRHLKTRRKKKLLMNINTYNGFCSHVFVSRETYEKFCIFHKILIKWQKSINLISKNSIKNIWERHFLDSAQLFSFVKDIKGNIFDFGSGAGFPGLVLGNNGEKNIHLVESDHKKCVFLKEIAILTDVDITIHNCRIENLSYIDVDLITCRALAPLNKLIDYVEIFINKSTKENKKSPKILFLKGKNCRSEVSELNKNKKIKF